MKQDEKNVLDSCAIVGYDSGNILFKQENGIYFREPIRTTISNGRKVNNILKWILNNKETNYSLVADVSNYLEDFDSTYENRTFFTREHFSLTGGDDSISVNGNYMGGTSGVKYNVKTINWFKLEIKDVVGSSGDVTIIVECCVDNVNWIEFGSVRFNAMQGIDLGGSGADKTHTFNNTIECPNRNFKYRFRFTGNGHISCKEGDPWWFSSGGVFVLDEKYIPNEDIEYNVGVKSITDSHIEFTRTLAHKNGFYGETSISKRNQKQHIKLYLVYSGNTKYVLLDEVYTDTFVDNLYFGQIEESKFLLTKKSDLEIPKFSLNSKIKQLLYTKNDIYINKNILSRGTKLSDFGFKISSNSSLFDSSCNKLTEDINNSKLKLNVKKDIRFDNFISGIENEIDVDFLDNNNNLIFASKVFLDSTNKISDGIIVDKIKKSKTRYKGSLIIYDSYNEELLNLVDSLSSCSKTPQTVFLFCTSSNNSNELDCVIDKNTIGFSAFKDNVIDKVKKQNGFLFQNINLAIDKVGEIVSRKLSEDTMNTVNNLVGFNVYNFTNLSTSDYMNDYGYYTNEFKNGFNLNNPQITFIGQSTNNSLDGITQFDISKPFEFEANLNEIETDLTSDMLNEKRLFPGVDKPYYSVSIVHNENVLYSYIVGRDNVEMIDNDNKNKKYSIFVENKKVKVKYNENLTEKDRGKNNVFIVIKKNDCIINSYKAEFLVDYAEPIVDRFELNVSDIVEETNYQGKNELVYSKDNFFKVSMNLSANYEFRKGEYQLELRYSKNKNYKIIRPLEGYYQSKIYNIHLDELSNESAPDEKIKFGDWECMLVRNRYSYSIKNSTHNIPLEIDNALSINAVPMEPDFDDFQNNGLQQGKDVYITLKLINSDYYKKIKDIITFVKEVRFLSNNVDFTSKQGYFTYLDENKLGSDNSLSFITAHQNSLTLDNRNEMRWFISGTSENESNRFLNSIANLDSGSKKPKNIKINLVLFTGEIIETQTVTIGHAGKVAAPILLGTSEHLDKLKMLEAKKNGVTVDQLTQEQLIAIDELWKQLGTYNYNNQHIINGVKTFAFYSNLMEMKFDFGIAEYYTISQANNNTEMLPVTKDGVVRYIINQDGIDENGKGILTIKGYVKLADGTINSSNEVVITFYRKRFPSMVTTGDDYTKYVFYEKDSSDYYALKTVIQSELRLENLNGTYDSSRIDHIKVELVDVDKRTVIAEGPIVKFYDGFVPQRFIFDTGLTDDDLNKLNPEERFPIENTKEYIELEKILNDKIFKDGRHLGQIFYLRFKAVESIKDAYDVVKDINGKESFYPIIFTEKLEELKIIPSNGIIVIDNDNNQDLYTYKNKVAFMLESNNAEYFMYRTDRAASFQKVYPKSVGYSKLLKIVVSTYDVGNHFLEVKQKAEGEPESNVYSVIVEKIKPTSPPKISGDDLIDENAKWLLHPVDNALKIKTSIITGDSEHSQVVSSAMPYEVYIQPDKNLDIGYHAVKAIAVDKINNESEPTYFLTKKIGRPIASNVIGTEKTSDNVISWEWESQHFDGVKEYLVEINGIEKTIVPVNRYGTTEYYMRFFQGKELSDGTYEIRVWAVNELGNKNYMSSDFITKKGSKIKELSVEMYKFKDNYTNRLEAKIVTEDKAIKEFEYDILRNDNGKITSVTGTMKTNQKILPFIMENGEKVILDDGTYYLAVRAINYIDEKTDYVRIPFIFKKTPPDKPYIYFQRLLKRTIPLVFVKPSTEIPILAIEIKIGDKPFEKVRNNVWRPNYNLPLGINNILIKVTDYAGNQSEFSDFIEITNKGVNMFQEDFVVDMSNPVLTFDFNLPEMIVYGHTNFLVENEQLGVSVVVDVSNANNIEIPLTYSNDKILPPDGVYPFVIKLYDSDSKEYSYIGDVFYVTIDSYEPIKPYFLNSGYSNIEYNKFYTQNRNPKWLWQTRQNIDELKEFIVNLYEFSNNENTYVDYGTGQFKDYSTKLIGQFQVPGDLADGSYKLTAKVIGKNGLESANEEFTFVVKNSFPAPPRFDLNNPINRKYENRNKNVMWKWEDTNSNWDEFVSYKVKINDEEFTEEFSASKTYYEEKRILKDGPNKIMVIGKDKAGNWSTANETTAGMLGANYLSNTKMIDTSNPIPLTDKDIKVLIKDSSTFEIFFERKKADNEYYMFELISPNSDGNDIKFVVGNTLDKTFTEEIYFREEKVIPGLEIGELNGKLGYCEIKDNSDTEDDKSLYFTNLLPNTYTFVVSTIDYAGNSSQIYTKVIELKDLTRIKPVFVYPKETYTNNNTIIFQWILTADNIKNWEYQLTTPYNSSVADLVNPSKWRSLNENIFKLNNIPKVVAGNDADGEYTFYVRAVFDETVDEAGTGQIVNKKSDISSITVVLDRKIPGGIIFTNKQFTTDNSVLRWTWDYTSSGDIASGTYVTFNPNLPITEWEKIENKKEYESYQEREDGVYTLYAKTFDLAGNINNTIYESTIVLDRIPPFKPIINGGSNIFTNIIPTISWENDLNYFRYAWLVMTIEEFNAFKSVYDRLVNNENYTLTNHDWKFIFSKSDIDKNNVNESIIELESLFRKNEFLIENTVTINKTISKNGISEEGSYVFILSGFDPSNNWSEEFEYQFITYDITAPDVTLMRFIEPTYVITDERRPRWVWEVPYDVTRCEYVLEKNGYSDGSIVGSITKAADDGISNITYEFRPQFNLTSGNYRLVVNCYDSSNNYVQINKSITLETDSSSLEKEFQDIILPGQNNRIRIQKNKYSDTYIIVDIDIDKNSTLSYRLIDKNSNNKEFLIYEIGKTELQMNLEYEFNILTYNIEIN
ncbi:MAG: hypothetical protein ACRC5S_03075 [Cetobacterium sp.]